MRKLISSLFFFVSFISVVSASNELIIHLDETGSAQFFGTIENAVENLPLELVFSDGRLRGATSELTKKNGSTWEFYFLIPDTEIQVYLPGNSRIISTNGELSIASQTLSEAKLIVYSQNEIYIQYTFTEKKDNSVSYSILAILAILLSAIIIFRLRKKIFRKNNSPEILEKLLNDREKLIISTLKKTGTVKYSYLRKQTQLPKASFARHIQELEKKGLIKKTGEGRNKFITFS